MAISQVRAQFMGQWVTLTYNTATRRYEGTITPTATSRHQPGGYYPITVEATNDTGIVSTASGTSLSWLRLRVLEAMPPVLTLVSPSEGYITTSSPAILLTAKDEAGGSGVDPGSVAAALDGVPVACTVTAAAGGYQVSLQPQGLSEGPHRLTVTVSDYDGNQAELTAAYIVDTVPPELELDGQDAHVVVDDASVTISGRVRDLTAPPVLVTVGGVGVDVDEDGRWSYEVPLLVGENTIPVRAIDSAGLYTDQTVYRIRMVTDRTEADVDALRALLDKPFESWTAAEQQVYYQAAARGAYNYTDLDRVGTAADYLRRGLLEQGYTVDVVGKRDWTMADIPSPAQMDRYLQDIQALKDVFPGGTPPVPADMEGLEHWEANDIEAILVAVDAVLPVLNKSYIISGEAVCGEF